jgi:diadenylate cyclase
LLIGLHRSKETTVSSVTLHDWWLYFIHLPFEQFLRAAPDVLVVAFLVYYVIMLAKGTRAWQVLWGLLAFAVIFGISSWLNLLTLNWILKQMFLLGPVALVILFLPEVRHALEEVGRLGFWGKGFVSIGNEDMSDLVSHLVRAASVLSSRRTGALIVIERETGLSDIIETGTPLNAIVTVELLGTLFYSGSPLHDGAVIIRGNRIVAAGCTLPLSDSPHIETTIHTRHKAALGISEVSDAAIIVVSEETSIISLAFEGNLVRGLRDEALQQRLMEILQGKVRLSLRRRLLAAGGTVSGTGVKSPQQEPKRQAEQKPKRQRTFYGKPRDIKDE